MDEMKAEVLPDTRPRARDRPRLLAGDKWDKRVSCVTDMGVKPRPKRKRPSACHQLSGLWCSTYHDRQMFMDYAEQQDGLTKKDDTGGCH